MDLSESKKLAENLLEQSFKIGEKTVNAKELGYKLVFNRRKRALGTCNFTRKTIALSIYFTEVNSEKKVKDTILHEMAHAFAAHLFGDYGHGKMWQYVCRQIGANPSRVASSKEIGEIEAPAKYVLKNKETGEVIRKYYRKPKSLDASNMYIKGKRGQTYGKLVFEKN